MQAKEPFLLLIVGIAALVVSAISPHDYPTWLMEVFPLFLGVPILMAVYRRFRMTPLVYRLVFAHSLILMLGAHYTYAEVPLGFWAQDLLHLGRNHYDRLGHLAQGFVPALLTREVLLRCTPLQRGGWLFFIVTSICLAISACYEFIEWWAALLLGQGADAFLGSQGDPWDTQWDMFLAFIGAMAGQILLGWKQDREMKDRETG